MSEDSKPKRSRRDESSEQVPLEPGTSSSHSDTLVAPTTPPGSPSEALIDGLVAVMRQKDVCEVQTEVDWTNHGLLRFLDGNGFVRAPRIVLERGTAVPLDI